LNLSSTKRTLCPTEDRWQIDWRAAGLRYFSYRYYLRYRFAGQVRKVSVDGGFTCPNVDGTKAIGGCTFCDNRSFSPSRRLPRLSVRDQIDEGIRRLRLRWPRCEQFLAYFQPATNTYAPLERLRPLYASALSHPQIVGLAIGTRPDCVPDDVLQLLEEIAAQTYLSVEYGLQTIHDRSLQWMNRGHVAADFEDAIVRSRGRGFDCCAHVILGLPGESHADMMATADAVARWSLNAVKIHNLYAVENTVLADQVRSGEVKLMGRDEFVSVLVDFLERLPPTTVVERVSGEAPPSYFIGPQWSLDKPGILRAIEAEFTRRNSRQGERYQAQLR
jgi:radical SAM protein (TIGR01212 family)